MSDGELTRLEVLRDLDQRRLTTEAATQLLGLERRQVFRLLKAYRTEGTAGLISKRENFFSKMTPLTHPPRRLSFDRQPADINACLAEHNTNPKLFPWTK